MDLHDFPLIAAVLAISALAGLLATRLRQPLIVAFIGVGILVGPTGLGWVTADGTIELLPGWASPSCCSWSASAWTCT